MKSINRLVYDKIRCIYPELDYIPLHAPIFWGNEKKYLMECIDSGYVSSIGSFVTDFENGLAEYTGARYAIACVNGTQALFLALKTLGVQEKTEVLTQSLSFISTANAIVYCGSLPVFIDVDLDTMGMSPRALKKWLAANVIFANGKAINKYTGNHVIACLPMHTCGIPLRIDEIKSICEEYNISLVEDSAESVGSVYKGKHTGTYGKFGIISFNGNKTITTGGGGVLLTNDEVLAQKSRYLSTQAKVPHEWEFSHSEIGYNFRMPNLNAALGLAQIEYLDKILIVKNAIADCYRDMCSDNDGILFLGHSQSFSKSSYWLNAIMLDNKEKRDSILEELNSKGIMTRPLWNLIWTFPMYKDCQKDEQSNSIFLQERVVNLPSGIGGSDHSYLGLS